MRLSSHTTPKSLLDADIAESARRTADLVQSDGTNWAVEELVAMKFAYIKHLAELVANDKVTEVVVPVPPPQFECDAIEISGLRTLAINDGTAVAVNYAMTRTFPTPKYHVVYDARASGLLSCRSPLPRSPGLALWGHTSLWLVLDMIARQAVSSRTGTIAKSSSMRSTRQGRAFGGQEGHGQAMEGGSEDQDHPECHQ